MAADSSTLYARLTPIQFTDFTPSRITRPSSNSYLQAHDTVEDLLHAENEFSRSAKLACNERALKGRYVDIEFAVSYPGGSRSRVEQLLRIGSEQCRARSDPGTCGAVPLFTRSRCESKRTAIRRKQAPELGSSMCKSYNDMVDTPSFVIIDDEEQPEANCNGVEPKIAPETKLNTSPNKIRVKKRRFSPPRSPPPLPPPLLSPLEDCTSPTVDPMSPTVERDAPVAPEHGAYVALHMVNHGSDSASPETTSPVQNAAQDSWGETRSTTSSKEDSPVMVRYAEFPRHSGSEDSDENKHSSPVLFSASDAHHHLADRWTPASSPPPSAQSCDDISPSVSSPLLQDSSSPPLSPQLRKTKPVPPPRRRSTSHSFWTHPADRELVPTNSSPEMLSDTRRIRSVSFLQCKVGQDCGQYPADYLGSKEIDCYIDCVDLAAKELVVSRTVDVVAYVTSEKIRLAPPNNSALLFKSFAMKELLSVQKCSKNKRIVGLVLWRPKSIPVCHVLRCSDHLVSSALYDAVRLQSQSVDDVTLSKVSSQRALDMLSRPPSDVSLSSTTSSSESDHTLSPRDTPFSPTELLHKFPATHIGSAVAGKLHSVNDVIQKVLTESRPSQAKEVGVWLSIAQVRLVDMSNDMEIIYAMHETSRIRAIGVNSQDKRFIGYIIKEEGKPLIGHVLRCNSAALMVSLVSFLRQSCQITFFQRGGSFYDELSADDSEEYDQAEGSTGGCEGHGILKRLRSLTIAQRSSSPTASFVSHTPLLKQPSSSRDQPQHHPGHVLSPLDFTDEDYARFSVNYVGSAALELPLTPQSVLEAITIFNEEGVAAGQAAVQGNVIHMQVSSLGINLTDKKHRLFVNRNYPRKQLVGYCVHPNDSRCFAIASQRPGFPSSMKVHVFRPVQEPTQQILDAIKFWLEIDPVSL